MAKSPDAFRTISEVAEWLGIQAHVLRFWESKFTQIRPVKRAGGRRYYRPADMLLLGGIRKLLHDDGLTIKGVQKMLREQGLAQVSSMSHPLDEALAPAATDGEAGQQDKVVRFQARRDSAAPVQIDMALEPGAAPGGAGPDPDPDPDPDLPAGRRAETGALPSFLHRTPARGDAAAAAAPPPPPATSPPATRLDFAPGVLTHLARIDRLSPAQARQVAPLAARLRGWLERTRHAATG